MYDVVSLGEALIDFTTVSADAEGYPTMAAHPGGAPANFLAALAKFGAKTALISKVGEDSFGRLLLKTLERAGIDSRGVIADREVFTTLAFVTLDGKGEREFSFARKPGADTCIREEEIDWSLIDGSRAFHFGTLSLTHEPARSATVKAVEHARAGGKLISFDPNLREPLWPDLGQAKEQMLWGLSRADVVKISDSEVEFLFGLGPEEGCRYIYERFAPKLLYVTCGAEGCWYINSKAMGHVPSMRGLHIADTTGAGDIFGGSAMYKLLQSGKAPEELEKAELERIVRFATAAAGLSATRPGGISSVPEPEELAAALPEEL